MEYIAYKIQLKNFPNSPPAPQLPYESIDLIIEGIEIHQIDDNKALLDNTRAQTSKIVPTTLITA